MLPATRPLFAAPTRHHAPGRVAARWLGARLPRAGRVHHLATQVLSRAAAAVRQPPGSERPRHNAHHHKPFLTPERRGARRGCGAVQRREQTPAPSRDDGWVHPHNEPLRPAPPAGAAHSSCPPASNRRGAASGGGVIRQIHSVLIGCVERRGPAQAAGFGGAARQQQRATRLRGEELREAPTPRRPPNFSLWRLVPDGWVAVHWSRCRRPLTERRGQRGLGPPSKVAGPNNRRKKRR